MKCIQAPLFFLCFILLAITSCSDEKQTEWITYFDGTGTYSSPRVADLNKDGVLDIIMGAGGREDVYSDTAVVALDGATGKLLWKLSGENQFVGSAIFKDINRDGIPDVFIGGRWAELAAINGADGTPLWKFFPGRTRPNPADSGWYNFTTPQWVADQDGDGLEDLIIANGGNPLVPPFDPVRPAGRILVLSSKTGKILANVTVPDGKETYMSVVVLDKYSNGNPVLLLGTGGETIGGHLYRTSLKEIMQGNISDAKVLSSSTTKGFIAPPVYADLTGDGIYDLLVNAVDGRMIAIDGASDSMLWQLHFPNTEAYTTPAVGFFNSDSVPDVFCNFAIGTFPHLTRSIRFMADGKTGHIQYQDTVPSFQYASPVVADLNGDGADEVLMYQSDMKRKPQGDVYFSYLQVFDFKNNRRYAIGDPLPATNLAATPWIGDLDHDQKIDVVYSAVKYHDVTFDLQQPRGLYIGRYSTQAVIKKPVHWGAYMGSRYTGVFPTKGY